MSAQDPARVAAGKIRELADGALDGESIDSLAAIIRAAYAERDRKIAEALRPFAEYAKTISPRTEGGFSYLGVIDASGRCEITAGDLRKAAASLAKLGGAR
jgi:hypothetical protein